MQQLELIYKIKRGRKFQFLLLVFLLPLIYACFVGLGISVLTDSNIFLYVLSSVFLLLYYILIIAFAFRSISNMMLVNSYLLSSSAIIFLLASLRLIIVYLPVNLQYIAKIDLPNPWNWLIAGIVVISFVGYLVKKYSELDIDYLRKELLEKGRYSLSEKTYLLSATTAKLTRIYKKQNSKMKGKTSSNFFVKRFFKWVLLAAYYFIPISPFVLRRVWHGEPISWIMLLGGLFFALMFGIGALFFYALHKVYCEVEKEIGMPLRPIRD